MLRIVQSAHEGEPAWSLEGEFTIYEVVAAKVQLGAALDQAPRLQLNLSGLEELDTAGLQLLDRGLYTYDIQHPPLARLAME